jgi:hypothetical protein
MAQYGHPPPLCVTGASDHFDVNPDHFDGLFRRDLTCSLPCMRLSELQVRHRTCDETPRERSVRLERAAACGTLSPAYASSVWCAAALPLQSVHIPEWRSYEHLDHPNRCRGSDSAFRWRRVLLEEGTLLERGMATVSLSVRPSLIASLASDRRACTLATRPGSALARLPSRACERPGLSRLERAAT